MNLLTRPPRLAGPGPMVPAANALLALCAAVDPGDDAQAWCQRAFLQNVRPLLTALTPGSHRQREADLAVIMLNVLPACLHQGPPSTLDRYDSVHETVWALVGTRTAAEAANRIERGVL